MAVAEPSPANSIVRPVVKGPQLFPPPLSVPQPLQLHLAQLPRFLLVLMELQLHQLQLLLKLLKSHRLLTNSLLPLLRLSIPHPRLLLWLLSPDMFREDVWQLVLPSYSMLQDRQPEFRDSCLRWPLRDLEPTGPSPTVVKEMFAKW